MANKQSDEARLRAEAIFKKKQQRTEEGEKVWAEHARIERS
jgi:hypothetical protein